MKRIKWATVLLLAMVLCGSAIGADGDTVANAVPMIHGRDGEITLTEGEFPPKYRVEIKIVYNAVTAERAAEVLKGILTVHDEACEIRYTLKKGDSGTGEVLFLRSNN